jgi:nucleotide-binding universal stress UspA family protein
MENSTSTSLRRILVPLDGSLFSEQALGYARAIGGPEAGFVLIRIFSEAEAAYGPLGNRLLTAEQVQRAAEEEARSGMERAREGWIRTFPNVDIEVANGDYTDEILAAAVRHQADIIVMATHGRGGLDRWIIGSVADRVARTSPIPVMLIHPHDETQSEPSEQLIQRLIVPLDGSELADQALPFAGRLAAQHDIPVRLVTVFDLPHELSVTMAYGAAFSQQMYDELLAEGRLEAEKLLAKSKSLLRKMDVSVGHQLLEGPVAKAIAGAAGENDMIVMTSHGRGGIRRLLLGSVASQLINQSDVPVVLVPAVDPTDQAPNERENNATRMAVAL